MSENKLVVCPYDEAHKVKGSRIQLHITRCRMNHLNEIKFTCPFNARHVMPYPEKDYHLLHCADKAPLDRILAETLDKNNPFKGRTAVPSYTEAVPFKSDENWDEEEEYNQIPGSLPTRERPSVAVVAPGPFLGASVKRRMYQQLHQHSEDIDFKSYLNSGSSIPAPIPRQPKQPSQALKYEDFPCLGIGRGKSSTIAKSIYNLPAATDSIVPVKSYSSVVSNNYHMNARIGQQNVTVGINCNSPDEILPLGLGRGYPLLHGSAVESFK